MNLVQKLPLGLALAACMMMSSCSQEDVQVAGPQERVANDSINLKVAAGPTIPTTAGWPGDHAFAPGWEKITWFLPDDKQLYSTGTSTRTHLWGNLYMPWIKPLPQLTANGGNNAGNFVTFMNQSNFLNKPSSHSEVGTKIKNLTPGKKYAATFYAASTIRVKNGETTQYCPTVLVDIAGSFDSSGDLGGAQTLIDLNGKEAEWVSKTITFVAQSTETIVWARASAGAQYLNTHDKFFHYAHLYVPQNAIVEIP